MDRDPDSLEGGVTCLRLCNLSTHGHAAIPSLDMEKQRWFKLAGVLLAVESQHGWTIQLFCHCLS